MDYYSVLGWYQGNVNMLSQIFGDVEHSYDYTWIRINTFTLPANWSQSTTKLLMILPGVEGSFTKKPHGFYLDQGLTTANGESSEHIFDGEGYNDISHLGWAKYSLHLKKWKPKLRKLLEGDNLLKLVDTIYLSLEMLANEKPSDPWDLKWLR